jgi:hypothetical protein
MDQQQVKDKVLVSQILWDSLSLKEAFLCKEVYDGQEPKEDHYDNFDIEIDEDKSNYKFHKKS